MNAPENTMAIWLRVQGDMVRNVRFSVNRQRAGYAPLGATETTKWSPQAKIKHSDAKA